MKRIDQSVVADFMNHGLLPFVGRSNEASSIVEFWRETPNADGVRVMLVTGEAGVGKSRLIDESKQVITARNGLCVHVKFYPESSSSMFPALASALFEAASQELLLRRMPSGDAREILNALVHVAQLRPTILILEDIHLLTSESTRDVELLMDAVSRLTLSVLCLARPLELPVRDVIGPRLAEEFHLSGLDDASVRELCCQLFGDKDTTGIAEILCKATQGNSLAIRSAMQAILDDGIVQYDASAEQFRIKDLPDVAEQRITTKVALLSTDLSGHLRASARQTAEMLSCLGEVFSHEAAMVVLNNDQEKLRELLFSGVIALSSRNEQPLPRIAPSARSQYNFTHSLVHSSFLKNAKPDALWLLEIFRDRLPVYSFVPFQFIAAHPPAAVPVNHAHAVNESLYAIMVGVDKSTDWRMTSVMLSAAEAVIDAAESTGSELQMRELRAHHLQMRVNVMRREIPKPGYMDLVDQLLRITESHETDALVNYRFNAIGFHHNARWSKGLLDECRDEFAQMQKFIDAHPSVRHTATFPWYLQCIMRSTVNSGDGILARDVERVARSIINDEPKQSNLRTALLQHVAPFFLLTYESDDELRDRTEVLQLLESENVQSRMFTVNRIHFLFDTGRFRDAQREIVAAHARAESFGLPIDSIGNKIMALTMRAALVEDPTSTHNEAVAITHEFGFGKSDFVRSKLAEYVCMSLMLRDEVALAQNVHAELMPEINLSIAPVLFRASELQDASELSFARYAGGSDRSQILRPLCDAIHSTTIPTAAIESTRRAIQQTLPTVISLAYYRDVYAAILACEQRGHLLLKELHEDLRATTLMLLEWLDKNEVWSYMLPLVKDCKSILTQREFLHWRKRAYEHRDKLRRLTELKQVDTMMYLRVIGDISVRFGDADVKRIRGSRNCATLALMVANECQSKRLTHDQFRELATDDNDPEIARKKLKTTVYRLREILGKDAVLTDSETPELNLKLLRVDLIDLHKSLGIARKALKEKSVLRASVSVSDAFDVIGGNVIFPGLYEECFETMREEFENRTREAAIRVIRAAIELNDPVTAESTARRALQFMPEDPEIEELLVEIAQVTETAVPA